MPEDDEPWRLIASSRDPEEQSHPEIGNPCFVEHVDLDADLRRDGRDAAGELARRQRIARLVRQAARQIAGFTEEAAAGDRRTGVGGWAARHVSASDHP